MSIMEFKFNNGNLIIQLFFDWTQNSLIRTHTILLNVYKYFYVNLAKTNMKYVKRTVNFENEQILRKLIKKQKAVFNLLLLLLFFW